MPKLKVTPSRLVGGVALAPGVAESRVESERVLHLPDRADEPGSGCGAAILALVKEFGHRSHCPVLRALEDGAEEEVAMLLAGHLRHRIEMDPEPPPLFRDAAAGAVLTAAGARQQAGQDRWRSARTYPARTHRAAGASPRTWWRGSTRRFPPRGRATNRFRARPPSPTVKPQLRRLAGAISACFAPWRRYATGPSSISAAPRSATLPRCRQSGDMPQPARCGGTTPPRAGRR